MRLEYRLTVAITMNERLLIKCADGRYNCTYWYACSMHCTEICDHLWESDHLRAFCVSRNTNLKYSMHCASPVAQYRHARYLV